MTQAVSNFSGNGTDEHNNKVMIGIASAFIISRLTLDIWSTVLTIGVSTIESPFQYISRCDLESPDQDNQIMLKIPNRNFVLPVSLKSGNANIAQPSHQPTYVSSLDFASNRMLGNIGAPLDGRFFNEEEEDNGENENRGCWWELVIVQISKHREGL
ncbi:hypothetical protein C8J55DRAFT_493178 [Lentinula edodes]|uniref:Uncharacterized protein n=1 Tax=Lentinula lateritia TaxID=40482 RepID=A0A9W8ZU40_9AGAR|nr:hypothetical protein C8J55DRAFT_493178 [Lentinula edodes]